MGWPLQPGENIRHVAQLIYPKNVRMQQIFIAETIKLNQEVLPELHPGTVFTFEQQITIPSIKQLSTRSRAGVKRND